MLCLSFLMRCPNTRRYAGQAPVSSSVYLVSGRGSAFTIPAGTLSAGHTYTVMLVGMQAGSPPGTLKRTFTLGRSDLVAMIAGGSRLVSRSSVISLDASESHDPDSRASPDAAMQFRWLCALDDGSMCRTSSSGSPPLTIEKASKVSVNVGSIDFGSSTTVTFTVVVTKDTRSSTTSMMYDVAAAGVQVLDVGVGLSYLAEAARSVPVMADGSYKVCPGSDILLADSTVASSRRAGEMYMWSVTGPGIAAEGANAVVDAVAYPFGFEKNSMMLDLFAARALFQAGGNYVLRLTVTSGGGVTGQAQLFLTANLPPSPGVCVTSPSAGTVLNESITVSCSNWIDDDLPLEYSFYTALGDTPPSISSKSYSASHSMQSGSPGTYYRWAVVYDSLGSSTTTSKTAVTIQDIAVGGRRQESVETARAGKMDDVCSGLASLGETSQLLGISDSVSSGFDTARRASSAAYRMRVRRMLLAKVGAGSEGAVTKKSASALLASTTSLSSNPEDLKPNGAENQFSSAAAAMQAAKLLAESTNKLTALEMRVNGNYEKITSTCESLLSTTDVANPLTKDIILMSTLATFNAALSNYTSSMLDSEAHLKTRTDRFTSVLYRKPLWSGTENVDIVLGSPVKIDLDANPPDNSRASTDGVGIIGMWVRDIWRQGELQVISQGVTGAFALLNKNQDMFAAAPPVPVASRRRSETLSSGVAVGGAESRGQKPDRRAAGSCTSPSGSCVTVSILVNLGIAPYFLTGEQYFNESIIHCKRWDGNTWSASGCSASSRGYINVSGSASVTVDCTCKQNGFVVVTREPIFIPWVPPSQLGPMTVPVVVMYANYQTLYYIGFTGLATLIACSAGYYILLHRYLENNFPVVYDKKMRSMSIWLWTDGSQGFEQKVFCTRTASGDVEVLERVEESLVSVTQKDDYTIDINQTSSVPSMMRQANLTAGDSFRSARGDPNLQSIFKEEEASALMSQEGRKGWYGGRRESLAGERRRKSLVFASASARKFSEQLLEENDRLSTLRRHSKTTVDVTELDPDLQCESQLFAIMRDPNALSNRNLKSSKSAANIFEDDEHVSDSLRD